MQRPVRIAGPQEDIITLAEAKAQCRVDGDDEDALIAALVRAATDHLDGWSGVLGRCLISQEWRLDLSGWPGSGIVRLPFPDVSAATITYYDGDGDEQQLADDGYQLLEDNLSAYLRVSASPALDSGRANPVRITFTAGYGPTSEDVPEALRQAAKLLVEHWHANRGVVVTGVSVSPLPLAVDSLIAPYRRIRI